MKASAEDGEENRGQRQQKQPADLAVAFQATALEVVREDEVVGSGGARFWLNGWGSRGHKFLT